MNWHSSRCTAPWPAPDRPGDLPEVKSLLWAHVEKRQNCAADPAKERCVKLFGKVSRPHSGSSRSQNGCNGQAASLRLFQGRRVGHRSIPEPPSPGQPRRLGCCVGASGSPALADRMAPLRWGGKLHGERFPERQANTTRGQRTDVERRVCLDHEETAGSRTTRMAVPRRQSNANSFPLTALRLLKAARALDMKSEISELRPLLHRSPTGALPGRSYQYRLLMRNRVGCIGNCRPDVLTRQAGIGIQQLRLGGPLA